MVGKRLRDAQAILAAQQNSAALEALLPEAEKLVWAIFWRHVGPDRLVATCLEPEDMYQQGMIGLLKAVKRYDAARGVPFVNYAVPVILGEMRNLLKTHGFAVRLPWALSDAYSRVQVVRERFLAREGREPSAEEIAARVGLAPAGVKRLLGMRATVSLDASSHEGDDEELRLMNRIGYEGWQEDVEARVDLERALSRLNEGEKTLLRLRASGLLQKHIGRKLGVTQAEISRRLNVIRKKLARDVGYHVTMTARRTA